MSYSGLLVCTRPRACDGTYAHARTPLHGATNGRAHAPWPLLNNSSTRVPLCPLPCKDMAATCAASLASSRHTGTGVPANTGNAALHSAVASLDAATRQGNGSDAAALSRGLKDAVRELGKLSPRNLSLRPI